MGEPWLPDLGFEFDEDEDGDDDDLPSGAEAAAQLAALRMAVRGGAGAGGGGGGGGGAPHLGSVLVVLLAADAAALGVWRGGDLVRHKVLTGYTVRRGQGGAQAAHEARGGRGDTAGAELRRREARRLWQRAAARLDAWRADVDECHTLFHSGAVRNFSLLYSATKPPPPVDRRDPRWRRLGVGVPRPRFASLLAAVKALSFGEAVAYDEEHARLL
ncbi:MAG: hypothetical protein J3K34DRAFT_516686 [Monoraphidium minutum]|nr:MAG: hypothetical protein J3K34DRAFT_516686 [Monoraphidium minutum]